MEYLPIILILASAGVVAGFLAGLMGIGGGIVTVPIIYWALGEIGVSADITMHMAVATSLLIIIPTSILSAKTHHQKGAVDGNLIKNWGIGLVVGAIAGPFLAADLDTANMVRVFGVMLFLMGLKLLFVSDQIVIWKKPIENLKGRMLGGAIGMLSSIMGIGGASFSVPAMTLMNKPIHQAVGTASLMGLLISIPGVIGFAINSFELPNDPFSSGDFIFGYFHLMAFLIIGPISAFMAPVGAKVSHKLPKRILAVVFGCYLVFTSLRMLWNYLPF